MKVDENGVLRPVASDVNWEPSEGVRVRPRAIQLGLTDSEIDEIEERIEELLEKVDEGDILLF